MGGRGGLKGEREREMKSDPTYIRLMDTKRAQTCFNFAH